MKPKILYFDLETTGLRADWDNIICACYAWDDGKVHTLKRVNYKPKNLLDDKGVAEAMAEQIRKANVVVGHYSSRFDWPFLATRMEKWQLPPLPVPQRDVKHVDTWRIARFKMKFGSNRLDNIAKFLGVKARKTGIHQDTWQLARIGDKKALKYIYEHCVADIEVLREVFQRIKHMAPVSAMGNVANMTNDFDNCPRCGGGPLHARGFSYTATGRRQRYQCQECGGWSAGKVQKLGDVQ